MSKLLYIAWECDFVGNKTIYITNMGDGGEEADCLERITGRISI